MKQEFDGVRAKLYKEALMEFPEARLEDIDVMKKYLAPKRGEKIVEIGAGSGFFSKVISEMIGDEGTLIVSDPSGDQLDVVKLLDRKNIKTIQKKAEDLELENETVDAIWSFGAMHHSFKKGEAFEKFGRALKKYGRLVIVDVFEDSKLAKHFDEKVDKYCIVGHNVEFWTDEMAVEFCKKAGLKKPIIKNLDIKWRFKSKKDIGDFLYNLHAMTKTTPEECLKGAEEILGIKKKGNFYELNWPMKIIITKK